MRGASRPCRPPTGGLCVAGRRRVRGFTLVELVIVMLLLAVVASFGAARFADREPFAVQGVADQLVSAVRLAQATAIAQRRAVHVVLSAQPAALQVCLDALCTQPLATPAGDSLWLAEAAGLQLSSAGSFAFGPDGAPTLTSTLQLRVQTPDGASRSPLITIEAGSGHVH
jgi:MSHA pilin protein MshC